MASFTDNLVAFNPYIQQVPVDDYVRVGMIKQQQYNAGVEKVQGYIDSVAGLEVLMPEQKDYLSQRINNIKQEVGRVVQSDFSNQQIVNSVGALTNKIASDPIIQNSVISTQNYKQGIASMKDAREKGKSSVSNEWDFNDQFQKWYNSKDITAKFSGSFTPYTDVTGKISKIIKDLDPNSHIEDIPYVRDANGSIKVGKDGTPEIDFAMLEKSTSGLTPQRIQEAISANMTQDDINQLRIDGRYSYRNQDAMGMKQITDQSYQYKLDQINDIIEGLNVTKQTLNNDPNKAAQIDAQIERYKSQAQAYQNRYKQDIATINSNLEGYKGALYTQNWLSKFSEGYAYSKESLTYKDNPYFQAAEKRRENDIKWNEFMVDQQWKAADAAYKAESLRLGWYNAESARLRAEKSGKGKTATGALEGIPLSDAILEPIPTDEQEQVDIHSFAADTQKTADEIDQQRMALLGNTGLVTIKRDPTGQNPRYEYNVAGKDPNTVINAANAAIAKLKDAYDKDPNSVPDGARVFFGNQANADQTIQNRKFAMGQQEKYADRDVGTIQPQLDKVNPLNITTGGKTYVVNSKQMMNFNEKLSKIFKTGVEADVPYAYYDDNEAKRILAGPEEWAMYQAAKKKPSQRNESDKIIAAKLQQTFDVVNRPNRKVVAARNNYLDNSVRALVGTQQPVSFSLDAFKPEDRNRARAVASNIVASISREGKGSPGDYFNRKDASEMLQKKNDDNTNYYLFSKGRGQYSLKMTNEDVSKEGVDIPLTRAQAEELFGQGQFLDDFYNIRQSLQLTKGTAKWTTDVRGIGREGAFNVNNGQLNRYSVKYHVEEPLKNGGLQVRMYIYDKLGGEVDPTTGKPKGEWLPERTAGFGQLLNEAQVTKFISTLGDQYIDSILKKDK